MDMKANEKIYSTIIGGCTTLGTGVGFFLFNISVFAFVGSIMLGTGVGLIVTALMRLSMKRNQATITPPGFPWKVSIQSSGEAVQIK